MTTNCMTLTDMSISTFVCLLCVAEETRAGDGRLPPHECTDMGRPGLDGSAVRHLGSPHLVGVLVGYHGACHLFCYLRHSHGRLRLLCTYQTGGYYTTGVIEASLPIHTMMYPSTYRPPFFSSATPPSIGYLHVFNLVLLLFFFFFCSNKFLNNLPELNQ